MSSRFQSLSIVIAVVLLASSVAAAAQVNTWRIAVPRGGIERAAVKLTNNCGQAHRFRVAAAPRSLAAAWDPDFVAFDARIEEVAVEPKSEFEAPFTVDARALEPGTYIREVRVYCLDCSTEPDCRPASSGNTLEIEVVEGASPERAPVQEVTLPPEPQAAMSNRDVLDLAKAGLGEAVILAKIRSSKCDFDTSVDALTELKAAGLSEPVILAMMGTTEANAPKVAGGAPDQSATAAAGGELLAVPDGTPVEIEVVETVTSEDLHEGDIVTFTVVQPVKIGDATVIEAGAPARARVLEVDKARFWGRSGKILWAMQDAVAVDGNKIPLRFSKEARGGGSSGKVGVAVVATAIVFWPAAPVWGLKKGKKAVVPAGQRYQVFVHGDAEVAKQPGS